MAVGIAEILYNMDLYKIAVYISDVKAQALFHQTIRGSVPLSCWFPIPRMLTWSTCFRMTCWYSSWHGGVLPFPLRITFPFIPLARGRSDEKCNLYSGKPET